MEEENDNVCIAKLFDLKGKKKNKKRKAKKETETVAVDSTIVVVSANKGVGANTSNGARISLFDFSVENFFRGMDTIAKLCRDEEEERNTAIEQSEIQRMSSFITFLREWRDFKYPSRTIRFAYGLGSSECYEGKDVSAINLPQFSSTTVPKHDMQRGEQLEDAKSQESRDFVMNVGGPVWALDWCPRSHEDPDCSIKCEYIAVAAHPPGSSYHKMGASLTGRGVVQIWCLLNIREHTEEIPSLTEKRKKRPKKDGVTNDSSTQIKRRRGRPRKNPTVTAADDTNCETQYIPSLSVQFAENSTEYPAPDGNLDNYEEISFLTEKRKEKPKKDEGKNDKSTQIKRPRGRPRKNPTVIAVDDTNCETQYMLPLTVQFAENSTEFPAPDVNLENNEEISSLTEKRKEKPKKDEDTNDKSSQMKRPRGRPRKNPTVIAVDDTNCETQYTPSLAVQFAENSTEFPAPDGNLENNGEIFPIPNKRERGPKKIEAMKEKSSLMVSDPNCEKQFVPLAVQVPEDSAKFISPDGAHGNCNEHASQQYSDTKRKHANRAASACNSKTLVKRNRLKINHEEERYNHDLSQPQLMQCENETNHQPHCSSEFLPPAATCSISGDLTLPRVVSCLAHNGKVAWDVKWRPLNIFDSLCKHRMGYLAVLLGNGSLEVWEVPLPHVLREIYMHREGTDPRFVKLEPVFKCSKLKRGSFQSIPLTMEWSVTPLHDYLLAGCHDGTVALWKFSTNSPSKCDDTKPVLCFGGDKVPIRTVAWAPFEGDPESSNIIVTAGHEGLKFWDLRNPFRPLRNLHPTPRIIYSLDWLSKPSCIIMSFEDGTMRTISLVKAANELPVTGTTYSGKKQPWLHSSSYSSSAIWSVHVSRITGMVAYCGADGTAVRFQLTTKAVETDYSHNRIPYFLCGSISEEESTLIVNTPVSNTPFPLRKSHEKGRHAQSFRDLLTKENLSKSASNQMAKASNSGSQTLALCDGDNLGLESGSEEALSSEKQPKGPKLKCSNKKKPLESTTLVSTDDVSTNTLTVDNEKSDFGGIPEVFPPKMVALHRVRWNMNKGSERWLCFGGASGLVRCQEIVFSRIDKKWALKR